MKRNIRFFQTALFFLFLVTIQLLFSRWVWADHNKSAQVPFEVAQIFIEFNSTDQDVGAQVSLDGDSWRELNIITPDGRRILHVTSQGSLKTQGLTEFFFESSEPSLDEVPLSEFLARFPVGTYRFAGTTIDGEVIESTDNFTHVIPDGPSIVGGKGSYRGRSRARRRADRKSVV